MTSTAILTRSDDKLSQLVSRELERRKFTGHGEIQLVLSDRKDEKRAIKQTTKGIA